MSKCVHENITITEPCCKTPDSDGLFSCGCGGRCSVDCDDCHNLSDDEAEEILTNHFE